MRLSSFSALLFSASGVFGLTAAFGAGAERPVTLAVHPYMAATEIHRRFGPLAEILGAKLGRPVEITVTKDYDEQIDSMGREKADMAYMGPAPYLKMADKYGKKKILGRFEIEGKATFQGSIFVAETSPVRTLAGLRGRSFAFGDKNSTMSHLVPMYVLLKAGVMESHLAKHEFLGNHNNVALAVLSGDFDAGAMLNDVFLIYEKRGLRKISATPEIPEHVLVAGRRISDKEARVLKEALYALKNSKEGLAVLRGVRDGATGIVPGEDKDYNAFREMMKWLAKRGYK